MTSEALTIAVLERWVLFGATWRVIDICADHATVQLCSCTGDPVERRESTDPKLIEYLRATSRPGE